MSVAISAGTLILQWALIDHGAPDLEAVWI